MKTLNRSKKLAAAIRPSDSQGMPVKEKHMKDSTRNNQLAVAMKDFLRAEAARYREALLRTVNLSPMLPSESEKCVRLIHAELCKAHENVAYAAADKSADPHTFDDCISHWGHTHVEVAAILLGRLSTVLPYPRWGELITNEIEALTKAVEHMPKAEAEPGGATWHLGQARRQVETALATHIKWTAAMGIDAWTTGTDTCAAGRIDRIAGWG